MNVAKPSFPTSIVGIVTICLILILYFGWVRQGSPKKAGFKAYIAAHRDHFVRCLYVRVSLCLFGSPTFLVVTQSYVSQVTLAFLGMLPLCLWKVPGPGGNSDPQVAGNLSSETVSTGLGCFEDLCRFKVISVISQLGRRRYPISEMVGTRLQNSNP